MGLRVVEAMVRTGRFGSTVRLRVDLHGVSSFGPGKHHRVIRWEWVERMTADAHGVTVTSSKVEIVLPAGVFGLAPDELVERLTAAMSIFQRGDILEELARAGSES